MRSRSKKWPGRSPSLPATARVDRRSTGGLQADLASPPYPALFSPLEVEEGIKFVKDHFERQLSAALNLRRVTAPLFVAAGTGINDHLNGIEAPVSFQVPDAQGAEAEIVQSLAKWKRMALARYGFSYGKGLYTDMNAIRPDEVLDNLHSIYVDQWDWERVITPEERILLFLQEIVRCIYRVVFEVERLVATRYPAIPARLPPEITFVHSEELEERYPSLSRKQREDAIAREKGEAQNSLWPSWMLEACRANGITLLQ